jgi:hypothetical protein
MLGKALREIDEADIDALVAASTPEGIALEFKRELKLDQRQEKREGRIFSRCGNEVKAA